MTTNMDFAGEHSLSGNSRGENSPGENLLTGKFIEREFERVGIHPVEIHSGEFSVH